jgi:[protein-PII] uridylyltransferase
MFGYEDATYTLAVEQFMQRYYRTVMDVSLLNELLLQLFREAILNGEGEGTAAAQPALPGAQRLPRGRSATTGVRAQPIGDARTVRLLQQHPEVAASAQRRSACSGATCG